jgi:hypothetical protein
MAFVITETKEAPGPGWCALNSAHVISTADVIGYVPDVGWVCPGCLASATDDR